LDVWQAFFRDVKYNESGIRLSECLNLRVQSFNFDTGILTVHDGKGQKDRALFKIIIDPMGRVIKVHMDEGTKKDGEIDNDTPK